MAWFRKEKKPLKASEKRDLPGDVFDKCDECGEILYRETLAQNHSVCPHCGNHFRITADEYLELLLDDDSFEELDAHLRSGDPLEFTDLKAYPDRIAAAEKKVGRNEAVVTGRGRLDGIPVCVAVMDFRFVGGSMGSVVGEKIARVARVALEEERPCLVVSASGGARMMEGIYSLMQMAKTSSELALLHEAGIPYLSICTDPTTGGVTASYAMLGDVNLAEPGALIGFAGPRVIEETIRQELPEGFQRSEFLLEHGMVDKVVDRRELRATIALVLHHMWDGRWEDEGPGAGREDGAEAPRQADREESGRAGTREGELDQDGEEPAAQGGEAGGAGGDGAGGRGAPEEPEPVEAHVTPPGDGGG